MRILICLIIFFSILIKSLGQVNDSIVLQSDSLIFRDSLIVEKHLSAIEKMVDNNSLLNSQGIPQSNILTLRTPPSSDALFYVLLFLTFFLAIIKTLFGKYFYNLLKVFFQTSLRQSQLTDQLMNAGLPSLLMNIFSMLTGAVYITLLSGGIYGHIAFEWKLFGLSILALIIIYTTKYLSIQFTGWISGYEKEAESYNFIIFLINKVIALAILPLLVLISFSDQQIVSVTLNISYFLIIIIFLLRYFRLLSLLQNRFKLNRFHFFLYIFGVELVPIFIICKLGFKLFGKNL